MNVPHANLTLAWIWMLLGFASGLHMGTRFHQENWMGGYSSLRRRLYRLGHISFFGTGMLNLMFFLTAREFASESIERVHLASWGFLVGAVTMPLCCLSMACFPRTRLLFAVPVSSLVLGGTLTLLEVIKS